MKKIIILYLLIINSVITFAQTTDLFYGNPTNNKKKIDKESSNLTQIEKPFILNIGDARSLIGISLIRPTNNNLLYSMGIHLGLVNYKEDILDNKTVNVPLVNLSLFLRTNNKNFNIKFGPYINIPLNGNIDFDETDFIDEFRFGPGIALGFDYSFKSGIALGLTQNLDLFFVSSILHEFDEYNPSWILPNLSVSYRFGTKKTKNILFYLNKLKLVI